MLWQNNPSPKNGWPPNSGFWIEAGEVSPLCGAVRLLSMSEQKKPSLFFFRHGAKNNSRRGTEVTHHLVTGHLLVDAAMVVMMMMDDGWWMILVASVDDVKNLWSWQVHVCLKSLQVVCCDLYSWHLLWRWALQRGAGGGSDILWVRMTGLTFLQRSWFSWKRKPSQTIVLYQPKSHFPLYDGKIWVVNLSNYTADTATPPKNFPKTPKKHDNIATQTISKASQFFGCFFV